jgi:radical SAM superfamily enzyme YgiQ (UPF0313 family)
MSDTTASDASLSVLFLYPDNREAVLGSPGFREVLKTLDAAEHVTADWGWFDAGSEEVVLERRGQGYSYDCIMFSVSFELLYATVVRCLISLGIEPEYSRRGPDDPLVMLGGIAPTLNPIVAGVIADTVYRGEAETALTSVLRTAVEEKKAGAARLLTPMIGKKLPKSGAALRFYYPEDCITSSYYEGFDKPASSTFEGAGLVEVGRGCSRGCRFCAAGHAYLPTRHRTVDSILDDVETYRGVAERIGLVGAAISDHAHLKTVIKGIIHKGFGLTTSSFRADMIDDELAHLLRQGGLRTITIAPEGGSERIRRIMKKNLDEATILAAAQACASAGFPRIKLYYMIGLPWERAEDVTAIAELTARIRKVTAGHVHGIAVSLNPFIPKPMTPFQWSAMADQKYCEEAYRTVGKELKRIKGVSVRTLSIRIAIREAVISLGNERVGHAIIEHVRDDVPWKKALRNAGVDDHVLVHESRPLDAPLPWEKYITPEKKTALIASLRKAESAAQLP